VSCILRAGGKKFDVDKFLKVTKLKPCNVFRKGEPKFRLEPKRGKILSSGINIQASGASFRDFNRQVKESIVFLKKNKNEIMKLAAFPGLGHYLELDFSVSTRDVYIQSDNFPPELIKVAGELGLSITLTRYTT
jgi:hypothetical protein